MTRPDYTEHYRTLESGLIELLRLTEMHLSPDDAASVQHYLDHGEYSLALEEFASGLIAAGGAPPPSVIAIIRRLVAAMGEEKVSVDLSTLSNSS